MTSDHGDAKDRFEKVGESSLDLLVVLLFAFVSTAVVLLPMTDGSALEILLGLLLVLFLPGYALTAALFPETDVQTPDGPKESVRRTATNFTSIGTIERLTVSAVTSISLAALVGLVWDATPRGIRLVPFVVSLCGLTVVAVVVAVSRRLTVPEERRFAVGVSELTPEWFVQADSHRDFVVNALVVLSLLFAASTAVYAVAFPPKGETYTEFYLLTENDTGELSADNYLTGVGSNGSTPLVVGIANHEETSVEYGVAVEVQRVDRRNGTATVVEQRVLRRFSTTLATNETTRRRLRLDLNATSGRVRLVFLLYRGAVPDDPAQRTAYRELHLWIGGNRTTAEAANRPRPPEVE